MLLSILPGLVSAQTVRELSPSVQAALAPGTTAWITGIDGREEKTRVVSVAGDLITTGDGERVRRFRPTEVTRIRVRDSDSVLNGALIGAGAAVASGLLLCNLTEPWENCRDDVGPMLGIGAIGAGVGVGIDALFRGRRTIHDTASGGTRLHAAPILGRHARGLQVALSF
jgi:hypothetical protein